MEKGGVNLSKLRSLMHDTCNTANATAREIGRLVEEKGRELYGDEAWESMPEEKRCVLDFLCGNHTRGLPVDAFNRRFDGWIEKELGDKFAAAAGESGGQARLEKSGTELLRSIFKLIHSGWESYEKVGLSVVSQSPCCSLPVVGCSSPVVGYRCRMPRALIFVLPENGGIGNNAPRAIRAGIPKWAGSATTNRGCEHQAQAPKRSVNCDFFYLCMHTKAHFFLFSAFCSLRRATTTSFVTTSGK